MTVAVFQVLQDSQVGIRSVHALGYSAVQETHVY
jgi:hypothetical protein